MRTLLNISCKGGTLRVTPDGFLVHMSMSGKPIWRLPVQGIIVTEVSRKIMATIDIRSPYGQYRIEWVSPDAIPRLRQVLVQASVQHHAPLPPPSSARSTPLRQGSWWRRQSKSAKAGITCGCLVAILLCCSISVAIGTASTAAQNNGNNMSTTTTTAQSAIAVTTSPTVKATRAIKVQPTTTPKTALKPRPTPKPTPTPEPTQAQATGINGNPWGYNFTPGNLIYNPPTDFCSYFSCISSFWNGHGYVNECQDGDYSLSGGIRGDCSYHGGELQPLYSH